MECPLKDLGELVRRLNPVIFNSINPTVSDSEETISELEERYEEDGCELLLQLRDELELERDKEKSKLESALDREDLKYLEILRETYGKTREEMVANLGEHIKNHSQCLDSYKVFLEAEANTNGYVEDVARRLGITLSDNQRASREDIIRFLDRECYLKIL